ASLQHVPHDHFVHGGGIDSRPAHRLADHQGAEPRRGQRRQPAQVLADGRAAGAENDGRRVVVGHRCSKLGTRNSERGTEGRGSVPRSAFRVQTNGFRALVRTSSPSFATNSSTGSSTCFFPSPRERTATVPASASRCPTTAMYGTLCVSPSRIL